MDRRYLIIIIIMTKRRRIGTRRVWNYNPKLERVGKSDVPLSVSQKKTKSKGFSNVLFKRQIIIIIKLRYYPHPLILDSSTGSVSVPWTSLDQNHCFSHQFRLCMSVWMNGRSSHTLATLPSNWINSTSKRRSANSGKRLSRCFQDP